MSSKMALLILSVILIGMINCTLQNRHSLNSHRATTPCPDPAVYNSTTGKCQCISNQIFN